MNSSNEKELLRMTATVQKWGNSLGVRIPKKVADKLELVNGSELLIIEKGDKIILQPVEKIPTLEELMASVEKTGEHEEIDWGEPRGAEIW